MALENDKAILPELIVILPPGLPSNNEPGRRVSEIALSCQ
jgi:hypothetical protein